MKHPLNIALCLFLLAACGEDKDYGEPLEDPLATQSALGAILNAQRLPTMTSNDSALLAADGLSANFNLMAGAKFNDRNQLDDSTRRSSVVEEACVEIDGATITYRDCAYGSAIVNGTVTIEGSNIRISARFVSESEDTTQITDVATNVDVDDTTIDGTVSFDLDVAGDGFSFDASFDGDFAVDLVDGCAVAGELEVHAVASSAGRRTSTWTKAEYAGCDNVVVR